MKYLLLFSSIVLAIVGQLLLKRGVMVSDLIPTFASIVKTVFSPIVFLGLVTYGISALIWLFVLQKFPLSVAYPALSLTYVVIVIASFYIFKEPLTSTKVLGTLLILFGVYLLFK